MKRFNPVRALASSLGLIVSWPFLKSLMEKNAFFQCSSFLLRSIGVQFPGPHGAWFGRPPPSGKPAKSRPKWRHKTPLRRWGLWSGNTVRSVFWHRRNGDVALFESEKERTLHERTDDRKTKKVFFIASQKRFRTKGAATWAGTLICRNEIIKKIKYKTRKPNEGLA